ncbi:Phomenoic acid biosynthesis cluster-specific transcriptional regulator-like protein [Cladobotryum mycophilum]|uniref:Phomenoic acid biosynthesis cluster-specific transcriptional regulator-like protein n=1 Tax=Cladobotryum mycophilum TaxID=491253 RepID=A0ABR0SWE8_9HYPO
MSPNLPKTAQQSPYCWECIRRNVICDGTLPICNHCRKANMVCPGYSDQKPLVWLPVGRVTRLRKSTTRKSVNPQPLIDSLNASPGPSTLNVSDSDGSSTGSSSDGHHLNDAAYHRPGDVAMLSKVASNHEGINGKKESRITAMRRQQARLHTAESQFVLTLPLEVPSAIEWDVGDLNYVAAYHDAQVMPVILSKRLAPGYTIPITGAFLAHAAPCTRYNLIALTISYRIMTLSKQHRVGIEPTASGPVARLWANFYRTIGLGIRALNEEIRQNGLNKLPNMMTSIAFLLTAEIGISSSPVWRAHATGFCSLIKYSGGILKATENPLTPPFLFQAFLTLMTVLNTTSPRYGHVTDVYDFTTEEIMTVYDSGHCAFFTCPGPLFLQIIRINSLRRQMVADKTALPPSDDAIMDILDDINDFSAAKWIESGRGPDTKDLGTELKRMKRVYQADLFHILDTALKMPVKMDHLFWPFIVAGVAAQTGTVAERFYVEQYLYAIMQDHMVGKPPETALAVLQRFWASDSLSWDDCFDKTYILLIF